MEVTFSMLAQTVIAALLVRNNFKTIYIKIIPV